MSGIASGCSARILAAVTFHFRESRLQFLFRVVRALAEYPVDAVDLVVITNVDNHPEINKIKQLCEPLFEFSPVHISSTKSFSIESFPSLSDPWLLPWCHKHLIKDNFIATNAPYTHFIYIEDDILLSYENFMYFLHYRERLKSQRLIPSFQRIEYNTDDNRLYLLDQIAVSNFGARKRVEMDGYAFVNLDYPYNAMYILDLDLALEYVNSRSSDRELSRAVQPGWDIACRSAMGLCFEDPPPGFKHRYVSPVNPKTLTTPCWSWVYHIANNYSTDWYYPFAKTRVDQLFAFQETRSSWRPPPKFMQYLHRLRRKITRAPALAK